MLGQQALLRAGGQAVQHEHPAARILLHILFGRQLRRVVAARQRAGDGHRKDLLGVAIRRQPIADIRAGSGGLALVGAQGLRHLDGIQGTIIVIFFGVRDDLQRHTGKVHAVQCVEVGG